MSKVTIYGASDDLIEVAGDLREEFYLHDSDKPSFLAFGDGTVLSIEYTNEGMWRVNRRKTGTARYEKIEATDPEGEYTDKVTLDGELAYVVFGSQLELIK